MATETRIVEPGDPYADPPRDWRRVGMLAGGWLLVWVVLASLGWLVMRVPALQSDARPPGSSASPTLTVDSFLNEVYSRGDANAARAFVCSEPGAPDPQALITERETRKAEHGSFAVTWGAIAGAPSGGQAAMSVTVSYEGPSYTAAEVWQLSLRDSEGWRICSVVRTPV